MVSLALIRDRFSRHDLLCEAVESQMTDALPAMSHVALLIPIFMKNEQPHVLLTIRSHNLKSDPGQVVFPGGKVDKKDKNVIETALREAYEEIGLPSDMAKVVGISPPGIILPNYLAHSVLAFIPETFVPHPSESEVARVFSLPLERFLKVDGRTVTRNHFGSYCWDDFGFTDIIEGGASVVTCNFTSFMCMIIAMIAFDADAAPLPSGETVNVAKIRSFMLFLQSTQSHL